MIKAIPNFENYAITETGRVWSKVNKLWLKQVETADGRLVVNLGKGNTKLVHRLVLETFVGPCPPGMETCHENDNPKDNRLKNLRWDTHKNNFADRKKNGKAKNTRGENHCNAKLTEQNVRMIIYMYLTKLFTQQKIADIYNVGRRHISDIVNKKRWQHVWKT